jgi:hypothetical protein
MQSMSVHTEEDRSALTRRYQPPQRPHSMHAIP